jgi:CheY-like chemotaxis protein/anti-anti-sigma regulatory factor
LLKGGHVTELSPKVLVIDDEGATLTMFRLFLMAYGYEVFLAEDGKTGIDLVRRHHPEIVFTDLKMPEIDGFAVLKEIKKIAPRTEVIVITGHGDMDLAVQALNLDATDFINKPIKRSALNAALQRATERLRHPRPDSCEVTFSLEEGIGRIRIKGTLRRDNRDQLLECCQKACAAECDRILLHFMDNAAVNGGGIAELINCLSAIRRTKKSAALVGLSENFRVIFQMVGVARFADLYDTESQAAAALS